MGGVVPGGRDHWLICTTLAVDFNWLFLLQFKMYLKLFLRHEVRGTRKINTLLEDAGYYLKGWVSLAGCTIASNFSAESTLSSRQACLRERSFSNA